MSSNFPKQFNCQEADLVIRQIQKFNGFFWDRVRKKRMLQLFHQAAHNVPAYKDFLKKNKISPDKIKTLADFRLVPPVTKKNYLTQYPLELLTWKGSDKQTTIFTSTSGSTGQPFYFPRQYQLDWQSSITHELFLTSGTHDLKKPILIIDSFGMGVWIGGLITYKAFELVGQRKEIPLSIITPGINKIEIFKTIKNLTPYFKQIILAGYPPFIKDVIDEAIAQGINLKQLKIRTLFAAEPFSETFREHLAKQAGIKNIFLDTANIYGSADLGTMASETPTSILIRRIAHQHHDIFKQLFSNINKTPTLAQYNPFFINFESENEEIFITGNNTLPLIRYGIGDHGGALTFNEVESLLAKNSVNLISEAKKNHLLHHVYKLPFVYVYERKDFSTTLYGLQVYPEYIREPLLQAPLNKNLTGKFLMETKFDKKHNQYLEINLELQKTRQATERLLKTATQKIMHGLTSKSSEYKELYHHLKKRAIPKLVFWPAEHPLYFKKGVKQKWVQNH